MEQMKRINKNTANQQVKLHGIVCEKCKGFGGTLIHPKSANGTLLKNRYIHEDCDNINKDNRKERRHPTKK